MRENFYIREIIESELNKCAEVIRKSFATVAKEFNLTRENFPNHRSFLQTERLVNDRKFGIMQFGLFIRDNNYDVLAGFVALKKLEEKIYELEMLSVLPEFRHNNFGRALIDFAKRKVKELDGNKIKIDIIEENTVLKNWYASNGFIHMGTEILPHLPFTRGYMEVDI